MLKVEFTTTPATDVPDCVGSKSIKTMAYSAHRPSELDKGPAHDFAEDYRISKKLLASGWAEGRERALEMHKNMWDAIGSKIETQDLRHDVAGFGVDVGRYLQGEPECMYEFLQQETPNALIEIWVNVSYSGAISQEKIFQRGAAVLALIDGLERSGRSVTLNICDTSYDRWNHSLMLMEVGVKDAGERLDIDKAAFMLAHEAFLRGYLFSCYKNTAGWLEYDPFARPVDYPLSKIKEGSIYVPKMFSGDPQWETPESCQAWVLEQLVKQGVTIR